MHSSLVSSLQASPTELNLRNIKIYTRSFEIYGIWPQASKQARKQASKHTDTRAQCSHASVGLAQACPNHNKSMNGAMFSTREM